MSNLVAVTTTGANMRQTAAKDAPIVAVLDKGAQVEVLGNTGNWLRVQQGSHTGFVYIELTQPQPGGADAGWTTTVIAQQLNLRAGASREASSLGSLAQNQQVPVTGYVGTWLQVSANGQRGFISADCTASVSTAGEAQAQAQAFAQTIAPVGIAAPDAAAVPVPAPEVQVKARLAPEEIAAVRGSIAQETNENARGDRYEELQSCVIYASQRDNQARNPDGSRVETRGGNMCNLTSLSMALSYLGIPNPKPDMQYEDALEATRQERHLPDRTTAKGWGGVAQALGARVSFVGDGSVTQGHDWWDANVRRPHLRQGAGVIMSIGGHIVRVQGVTDQGLVVDDPYGRCRLLPGEAGAWKYALYNEYDKPGQTAGEDTLWPEASRELAELLCVAGGEAELAWLAADVGHEVRALRELGVLTLIGDALKGFLPVLLAVRLGLPDAACALVALAAFAGHLYPCFLGFSGGKGVAVALGVLLGLAPLGMAVAVPVFLLTVAVSRYVSLGSLLSAAVTPVVLAFLGYPATTTLVALIMGIGIAIRHRDNIRRIRFGTEARLGGRTSTFPDSGYA